MNQEIFSKTCTHLLRQGATSEWKGGSFFNGVPTKRHIQDELGRKCPVYFMATTLHRHITEEEFPFGTPFFICHDYVPQERWPGFMRGIARFFGLSELSIDIWEAEQAPETPQERHTAPSATLRDKNECDMVGK